MIHCLPDCVILLAIYAWKVWPTRRCLPHSRFLNRTVLYLYLCGVLAVTLMPVLWKLPLIPFVSYRVHLNPFEDYLRGWGDARRQILLNIAMLLPFGLLFPRETGGGCFRTVGCGILLSLTIELLQPFFGRSCDITDLITNSLGCIVGFCLYRLLRGPLAKFDYWIDAVLP